MNGEDIPSVGFEGHNLDLANRVYYSVRSYWFDGEWNADQEQKVLNLLTKIFENPESYMVGYMNQIEDLAKCLVLERREFYK